MVHELVLYGVLTGGWVVCSLQRDDISFCLGLERCLSCDQVISTRMNVRQVVRIRSREGLAFCRVIRLHCNRLLKVTTHTSSVEVQSVLHWLRIVGTRTQLLNPLSRKPSGLKFDTQHKTSLSQ